MNKVGVTNDLRYYAAILTAAVFLSVSLSACSKIDQALTTSPEKALERAEAAYSNREYSNVDGYAKAFADKEGVRRGQFALVLARAYAKTGRTADAVRYLRIALNEKAIDAPHAMTDDGFEGINTEISFVQLMTE